MRGLCNKQAIFFSVIVIMVVILFLAAMDYRMASNPPQWWLDRNQTSQKLYQQTEETARFVTTAGRLEDRYIPKNIKLETSGKGVVVSGPKHLVYQLHREIYQLDEDKKLFFFTWKRN